MEKKRRFCRNQTQGSRRGQKWPESIRTAAMCDLLVSNNICAVARKYGVPESTLRTWMTRAERMDGNGRTSLFAQARQNELRKLNHLAAQGAAASVEYIRRRLEVNDRDAELYEGLKRRMDRAEGLMSSAEIEERDRIAAETVALVPYGAQGTTEPAIDAEEMQRIELQMARHEPMTDKAAAAYLVALTAVTEKSGELLKGGDTGQQESGVVMLGAVEPFAPETAQVIIESTPEDTGGSGG